MTAVKNTASKDKRYYFRRWAAVLILAGLMTMLYTALLISESVPPNLRLPSAMDGFLAVGPLAIWVGALALPRPASRLQTWSIYSAIIGSVSAAVILLVMLPTTEYFSSAIIYMPLMALLAAPGLLIRADTRHTAWAVAAVGLCAAITQLGIVATALAGTEASSAHLEEVVLLPLQIATPVALILAAFDAIRARQIQLH